MFLAVRLLGHWFWQNPSFRRWLNHGRQVLHPPTPKMAPARQSMPDLADLKGQDTARHFLEIAAAGGHYLLMVGLPGAGKSMPAARLAGLLPPLNPVQLLLPAPTIMLPIRRGFSLLWQ